MEEGGPEERASAIFKVNSGAAPDNNLTLVWNARQKMDSNADGKVEMEEFIRCCLEVEQFHPETLFYSSKSLFQLSSTNKPSFLLLVVCPYKKSFPIDYLRDVVLRKIVCFFIKFIKFWGVKSAQNMSKIRA